MKEITLEARRRLSTNPQCVLLDVRARMANGRRATRPKPSIWARRACWNATWKKLYPNPDTEILMYCGGGFAPCSASAARRMGY